MYVTVSVSNSLPVLLADTLIRWKSLPQCSNEVSPNSGENSCPQLGCLRAFNWQRVYGDRCKGGRVCSSMMTSRGKHHRKRKRERVLEGQQEVKKKSRVDRRRRKRAKLSSSSRQQSLQNVSGTRLRHLRFQKLSRSRSRWQGKGRSPTACSAGETKRLGSQRRGQTAHREERGSTGEGAHLKEAGTVCELEMAVARPLCVSYLTTGTCASGSLCAFSHYVGSAPHSGMGSTSVERGGGGGGGSGGEGANMMGGGSGGDNMFRSEGRYRLSSVVVLPSSDSCNASMGGGAEVQWGSMQGGGEGQWGGGRATHHQGHVTLSGDVCGNRNEWPELGSSMAKGMEMRCSTISNDVSHGRGTRMDMVGGSGNGNSRIAAFQTAMIDGNWVSNMGDAGGGDGYGRWGDGRGGVTSNRCGQDMGVPSRGGQMSGSSGFALSSPKRTTDYSSGQSLPPPESGYGGQRDSFVFMSYNILAGSLAEEHWRELYSRIHPDCLAWPNRRKKILKEIVFVQGDVVCLQEVENFGELETELSKMGYQGTYRSRTGNRSDGCAVFWKTEKFKMRKTEVIEFIEMGLRDNVAQLVVLESIARSGGGKQEKASVEYVRNQEDDEEGDDCRVITGSKVSARDVGGEDDMLIWSKDRKEGRGGEEPPQQQQQRCRRKKRRKKMVVVGNIHVLFNPKRGDIKMAQIRTLIDRARELASSFGNDVDVAVVLAGDFNCSPGSPLYQFISNAELDCSTVDRRAMSGVTEGMQVPNTAMNANSSGWPYGGRRHGPRSGAGGPNTYSTPSLPSSVAATLLQQRNGPALGGREKLDKTVVPDSGSVVNKKSVFQSAWGELVKTDERGSERDRTTVCPDTVAEIEDSLGVISLVSDGKKDDKRKGDGGGGKRNERSVGRVEPLVVGVSDDDDDDDCVIAGEKEKGEGRKRELQEAILAGSGLRERVGDKAVNDVDVVDITEDDDQRLGGRGRVGNDRGSGRRLQQEVVSHKRQQVGEKSSVVDLEDSEDDDTEQVADKGDKEEECAVISEAEFLVKGDHHTSSLPRSRAVVPHTVGVDAEGGKEPLVSQTTLLTTTAVLQGKPLVLVLEDDATPRNMEEKLGERKDERKEERREDFAYEWWEAVVRRKDDARGEGGGEGMVMRWETPCPSGQMVRRLGWEPGDLERAVGVSGEYIAKHGLSLISAYVDVKGAEPPCTSYHDKFMGTVDYIWHTRHLEAVRVLETVPPGVLRRLPGLPAVNQGSDHMALACEFAFIDRLEGEENEVEEREDFPRSRGWWPKIGVV
ncbi:hypothetical protein CBR_g52064 [Chara braunii]|uniref:C3H1-type domain-containing protein n=1 Tax=Chara braunii TaxID=69332 RepID=A0A388M9P0_CHABU|nr:hypothetical protein CBR_g52064 [Chara braunii]|eukprot:GBG91182.1 hypothetical protein CBR_g52064 [Chara braunii]